MKVCIVGGGNIGTALACSIKNHNHDYTVSLYTRHPEQYSGILTCNDIEHGVSFNSKLDCISSDPKIAASDANLVFIALPHFAVEQTFMNISPYVSQNSYIGVVPGYGGCEFFFYKYFKKNCSLFGFQRVPFITRLKHYGKEVDILSWKPYSIIAAQHPEKTDDICKLIESCGLVTRKASNYLSIALAPTNPILHTSRLFQMFSSYPREHVFDCKLKLYVGWTDYASEMMLSMDEELHKLLDSIPEYDTTEIRPLTEHYDSPTAHDLTIKINSIPSFQTIYSPMIDAPDGSGYVVDTSSRLFTEDFPYGLAIIRADCQLCGIDTPSIDQVLSWYAKYVGKEYYLGGRFVGKDLAATGIPQKYGITTRRQLLSYYQ